MNISQGENLIKYPYIRTLKKYWLQYGNILEYPDYGDILSPQQIKLLYNILKDNQKMLKYINNKEILEDKDFLENLNITEKLNTEEIKNIFLKISQNKKSDKKFDNLYETEKDFTLYSLFYRFSTLSWLSTGNEPSRVDVSTEDRNINNENIKMITTPYFYYPYYSYSKNSLFRPGSNTPCSIALLVDKELNFLLMKQDVKKFRREESGLESSQQLKYSIAQNLNKPIQEKFSYINRVDKSKYGVPGIDKTFNPEKPILKKKNNFNPTIPYNKKLYGISSSNLLALQIVEAVANSNNNYVEKNNLTHVNVIMDIKAKNNIVGISSNQLNGYNNQDTNVQVPNLLGDKYLNINPRLYNQP